MRDIRCGVRESGEPGEDGTDDGTDDKPSDQTRPVLELELIKAGTRVSWCEKWIQNGKDRDAEPVLKDKCNQWMGKKIISLGNELTKLQDQIMVEQKEGKTYEQWSITMKKTIPMYRHYHRLLKLVYVSTEFGLESMYRAQLAIAMHLYDLGEGDDEDDKFYMHSVKESITNIAKIRNLNTSQAQKLGFVKMMELSEATFIKDGNRYWTDRLTRFCSRSSYSFEYFYEDHKVCEYPKTLSNLPMHLRHHVSDPPVVEATLQRHKGKETQMFSKLVQKYESGSDTDADSKAEWIEGNFIPVTDEEKKKAKVFQNPPTFFGPSTNDIPIDKDIVIDNNDAAPDQPSTVASQASKYFERTSGLCTDGGGSYIGIQEDCNERADVFGYPGEVAITKLESTIPPGCLRLYGHKRKNLKRKLLGLNFNTETSSTEPCSSKYKCICKLTSPETNEPVTSEPTQKDMDTISEEDRTSVIEGNRWNFST